MHQHMEPQQPNRQIKYDHMTRDTPQGHRSTSRSERNLIILQVNINGIKKTQAAQTTYPPTTKQLTLKYNTAYSTSQWGQLNTTIIRPLNHHYHN